MLIICLVTGTAGAGEATSQNFRLIGQTSLMAAGGGGSTNFRLQSCIDSSPAGISSSSSFKLDSGCVPLIQAAKDTPPTQRPTSARAVPLLDGWKITMLVFLIVLLAWSSRGGRRFV